MHVMGVVGVLGGVSVSFLVPSFRIGKMPHIVCVSGTFSPPHRGHVLMAIESARSLRKLGKNVAAVCFGPVHDNYLRNKVSADAKEDIAFSSSQRVLMLKELIAQEQANDVKCIVLDWECENKHLLTESASYFILNSHIS